MNIIYHVLSPSDCPSILPLLDEAAGCFPNLSAQSLSDAVRSNTTRGSAVAAFGGASAAGIVTYSMILNKISFLYVSPGYRRRGIARELVEYALTALPGREVTVETFTASDPRDAAARALYQSIGFTAAGELNGYSTPMERFVLRR